MKFINSASRAFDALCVGVDAIASSTQLLSNKVAKEITVQQRTAKAEVNHDVELRLMELKESMTQNIKKQQKLRAQDPWAFSQAERVLRGESIEWDTFKENDEVTSIS